MVKWNKLFKSDSKPAAQLGPAPSSSSAKVQGALGRLAEAEELLVMKQQLLERQIVQQLETAREATRQNKKKAALAALRKKKMYETQLEQIDNSMLRINEQQLMLENSQTTITTVAVLGQAAKAVQVASADMSVEQVDALRVDLEEQHEEMRQVQEALGMPLGTAIDLDYDDLEAELEDLEELLGKEVLEGVAHAPVPMPVQRQVLPSVPSKQHAAGAKTGQVFDLKQLEAELLAA